jgi:flagellar hook-length control protein FliK
MENQMDGGRQNDPGSTGQPFRASTDAGTGQPGPAGPNLFSSGQVTIDTISGGGDTPLSETQSPQENSLSVHSQEVSKGEQIGVRSSESPGKSGAELPDFFTKIVDRAVMTLRQGQSEMKMVLKPEFLGQVRMQVRTENQHLIVRIVAETHVVKEVIENNLGQLKADLQSHGLEVDEFDVMTSQDSQREGQNSRHLHTYRHGSKMGEQMPKNQQEDEPEKQVSTNPEMDPSGRVDFFA